MEQLDWFSDFPSIVRPEPVVWGGADHLLDGAVEFSGGGSHVFAVDGYFRREGDFPATDGRCLNRDGDDGCVGSFCENRDQWGRGGDASKQGAPDAAASRVLVCEHSDNAWGFQNGGNASETAPVKQMESFRLPLFPDVSIDSPVSERLVNGGASALEKERRQFCDEFPV